MQELCVKVVFMYIVGSRVELFVACPLQNYGPITANWACIPGGPKLRAQHSFINGGSISFRKP